MSSTPLFDSIARRAEQPGTPAQGVPEQQAPVARPAAQQRATRPDVQQPTARPAAQQSAATAPAVAPVAAATAPTSPFGGAVAAQDAALVPAALVAAIDEIPARIGGALAAEHVVCAEQLVLVEAVADALTRAVVDAVVHELDRIARDGVVRV